MRPYTMTKIIYVQNLRQSTANATMTPLQNVYVTNMAILHSNFSELPQPTKMRLIILEVEYTVAVNEAICGETPISIALSGINQCTDSCGTQLSEKEIRNTTNIQFVNSSNPNVRNTHCLFGLEDLMF